MLQVLVALSLKFCCRKEALGYAKVIHKKRESSKKMDKCPRYLKQWVLRCPLEKKEMNKIAPTLSQKCFQVFKREISFQGAK